MGGKAFHALGGDAFPRIPPPVYSILKKRFTEDLKTLYEHVGVPHEAPEKEDHGDVDFIVCCPRDPDVHTTAFIKEILGAEHAILAEGNRTSNFAVPAGSELGYKNTEVYAQVDVHLCGDKAEWQRTLFFNSYGDLGMILGLIVCTQGFTLGTKGLRTRFAQADDTHISSFVFSESFDEILPFLGLSMKDWEREFPTLASVFSWVQGSRFFEPKRLVTADPTKGKRAVRQHRKMYSAFLEFSDAIAVAEAEKSFATDCKGVLSESAKPHKESSRNCDDIPLKRVPANSDIPGATDTKPKPSRASLLEEALVYFDKKDIYDALVAENVRRRAVREKLNGTKIIAWTGAQGIAVKWIIDSMRERLSEHDIVALQDKQIRQMALDVQRGLGLLSNVTFSKTVGTERGDKPNSH